MKALVTGGAGFIGHQLVRALLNRGDDVVVLDDFSTGFHERLEPFGGLIEVLEGSICDRSLVLDAAAGCQVIFHEAALASVERSLTDPVLTNEINVTGTIEVVLAAAEQGVRRVILASSSAVYGTPDELPCRETTPSTPESPYGASKLAAEHYLHTVGRHVGVETVALRYFNVFGPGQDPKSDYAAVIPIFITALLEGRRPVIFGDGETTRDFVYVDDVAAANLLAVSAPVSGRSINVASGEQHSLLHLLSAITATVGSRLEPAFGPPRAGDIKHSVADVSMARSVLGYEPAVPFSEGMARTVAWYKDAQGDVK